MPYKAILFDLDGVITDTRDIHFKSWKMLFENFFKERGIARKFSEIEYKQYFDGRPREDGISLFLKAMDINVTESEFHSLKNNKNIIYLEILGKTKLEVFSDFDLLFHHLKSNDVKTAVVSSSQNCRIILSKLNIEDNFNAVVDGVVGKRLNLKGKPSPDYFLEAAKSLGVSSEECAVVEDAVSGVMAGHAGHFFDVFGISRRGAGYLKELKMAGANKVISSLEEMIHPPNALIAWDEFKIALGEKDLALFLDFDGTLSDIVESPGVAILRPEIKPILKGLSRSMMIAVVSGRDRSDVKERVGLDSLFYAGSHGFDMSGPGCFHYQLEHLDRILQDLQKVTLELNNLLARDSGVIIERKAFGTAVHYRLADPGLEDTLRVKLHDLLAHYPGLTVKEGKKVFEIIPDVKWSKGKAVLKLLEILNLNPKQTIPIYIGDDITDEDAFTSLQRTGISIRVDDDDNVKTHADYVLKNPGEVFSFLDHVLQTYSGDEKKWSCGT